MAQTDTSRLESVTKVATESAFADLSRAGLTMTRLHCLNSELGADLRYTAEANSDERVRQHSNPAEIRGTTDGSKGFPIKCYVKGIPSAQKLSAGASPSLLSQHIVLSHAIGRGYYAAGCTITSAASATVFTVDNTTNLRVGAMIEVETSTNVYELAVIKGLSAFSGSGDVTLETGLSGTPAGTGVRVVRSYCLAERATSTLIVERKYVQDSGYEYRLAGCRGGISLDFGDWNKPFTWTWTPELSAYQRDAALTPSFGSYAAADDDMDVPLVWSPVIYLDTTIETASDTPVRVEKVSIEIPAEYEVTHNGSNTHGIGGVVRTSGRPFAAKVKLTIRADTAEAAAYAAKTIRAMLLRCTNSGSTFAVYAPRLEHAAAAGVKPVALGKRIGYEVTFNALPPTGRTAVQSSPSAEEADFMYSPIVVGLA
jgi:hypothetical protein